ncbi:BTAD domain-containing putative transcriptional regulator [Umezawaea sp.]|uniref:BTAD domain-containing putative transcriptional regulator n=1 Tax=Umezawaea sp. TaxID=1955258 RepID=UPI002ED115DC
MEGDDDGTRRPDVVVGVLGGLEVRRGDELVPVGHARQRSVLAALAADANRVVPVDGLLDRVWGERPPSRARSALRTYLSHLRRALAPVGITITRQGVGYLLATEPETVDAHRFHRLLAAARARQDPQLALDLVQDALALWRGEPLAELDTPWALRVRERWRQERAAAEADRIDWRMACGLHGELLPELAARANAHPFDERAAGQHMLALYRSGRQAEALEQYRRTRHRLADALGTDPAPPLREVHQRILTADPTLIGPLPSPAVPRQDPPTPIGGAGPPVRDGAGPPPAAGGRLRRGTGAVLLVCSLLAAVTAADAGLSSAPPPDPCPAAVRTGDVGACVEEVQSLLVRAGLAMPVDGVYGPFTKMRVAVFQLHAGMAGTGVVDGDTLRALRAGTTRIDVWPAERVERRLREVFPEEPDRVVDLVRCLSHLDPVWMIRYADGTRTWGLFQLTDREVVFEQRGGYLAALDPEWNVLAARAIRDRTGGLDRWTCPPAG